MTGRSSRFRGAREAKNPRFLAKDFTPAGVCLSERNSSLSHMKKFLPLVPCLLALAGIPVSAQSAASKAEITVTPTARSFTKFDLDFPGGTPGELVAAIQQATKRPLNAIIPTDRAAWKLPPIKMANVSVAQLFRALEQASQGTEVVSAGNGAYSYKEVSYGFRSDRPAEEPDDTIWFFYVKDGARIPKLSRFYLLTPYLDAGLTVDDITTAIQTGWKMRGEATPPALSFHKETKLLIAVGDGGGLDTIDAVLRALDAVKAKPAGAEKTADEKKTKS